MQDTFARATHSALYTRYDIVARAWHSKGIMHTTLGLKAEQPLGQARATIGYLVYKNILTIIKLYDAIEKINV